MRILFVHQNFPGQFGHLAAALAKRGDQVFALHYKKDLVFPEIESVRCEAPLAGSGAIHPLLRDFDAHVRAGEVTARRALDLKNQGLTPDVIIGHPGWGEMLFLRDLWPNAPMLCYPEYGYTERSSDASFDQEFEAVTEEKLFKLRIKDTVNLHAFAAADQLWCPTEWQRSSLPREQRTRTIVIHDGIDTDLACPNSNAAVSIMRDGKKQEFAGGDELITFVNRHHDPVRGFHTFMRALPAILARRPRARVILIGGDGLSYGGPPPGGGTWRQYMLRELNGQLDMSRIYFVGKVPKEIYLAVLQLSSLHVYLTYPFVLSWSFLEAMSCGCRILASKTGPVTEFVEEGINGTLFDFFRPDELAAKAIEILHHRGRFEGLRRAARQTVVDRCDLRTVCLPAQKRMIDELVARSIRR